MEKFPTRGASSLSQADLALLIQSALNAPRVSRLKKALAPDSSLCLVGGTVRDLLLSRESAPQDLDLATKIHPEEVMKRLNSVGIHSIPTGLKHGTITAVVDGANCEITTFRVPGPPSQNEKNYSDSIEHDLAGRDFTINAMALSVDSGHFYDPFQGYSDLRNGILRAVGNASIRFQEDPLRILRMLRFGPAQNRTLDPETLRAGESNSANLVRVSPERIRSELVKILLSPKPSQALRLMANGTILDQILPEFRASVGCEQNQYHRFDVFEHTLAVIENAPSDEIVRLACLFHDIAKPFTISTDEQGVRHFYKHEMLGTRMTKDIMQRLRFSHADTDSVSALVEHHMRPLDCGPAGVRRLLRDLGIEFERWLTLKRADALGAKIEAVDFDRQIQDFLAKVEIEKNRKIGSVYSELALGGNDILALGIKSGPKIGEILKLLWESVLDNPEINTHECLIDRAKTIIRERGL